MLRLLPLKYSHLEYIYINISNINIMLFFYIMQLLSDIIIIHSQNTIHLIPHWRHLLKVCIAPTNCSTRFNLKTPVPICLAGAAGSDSDLFTQKAKTKPNILKYKIKSRIVFLIIFLKSLQIDRSDKYTLSIRTRAAINQATSARVLHRRPFRYIILQIASQIQNNCIVNKGHSEIKVSRVFFILTNHNYNLQ